MKEEGIKKGRSTERKKEFRVERRGEKRERERERERERKQSSAGFKQIRLFLLVFLSVKREVVVGGIGFTFLPS